jgi:adenosylcobinamide-phosphate synthase
VAFPLSEVLAPHPMALLLAVAADLAFGDPVYRAHPIRLLGHALTWFEHGLRRIGADGYGGGIALFVLLAIVSVGMAAGALLLATRLPWPVAWLLHGFVLYSLLALGDLLRHVWRVERGVSRNLTAGRDAIAQLVGRDTDRMDAAACRRAAVESLSENLTDGFTSPVFW